MHSGTPYHSAGHVVYEMGVGTIVKTAIPTDADYKKISNEFVRGFVISVFDGIHETTATSASDSISVTASDTSDSISIDSGLGAGSNSEWTEVCSYHISFNSSLVRSKGLTGCDASGFKVTVW